MGKRSRKNVKGVLIMQTHVSKPKNRRKPEVKGCRVVQLVLRVMKLNAFYKEQMRYNSVRGGCESFPICINR